jgi:hypothetical protein
MRSTPAQAKCPRAVAIAASFRAFKLSLCDVEMIVNQFHLDSRLIAPFLVLKMSETESKWLQKSLLDHF